MSLSINVCMFTVSNVLCCDVRYVLCYVWKKYGRITFWSVFAITDRRDIDLYDVPMLMCLLGLGIGMMLASFHR